MGQAVKYAVIGVALVAIIALVVVIIGDVTGTGIASGFSTSVTSFINNCSSVLQSVRGALNYACGQGGAIALNLLIWMNILLPLILIPVRIVITIHRFINQ